MRTRRFGLSCFFAWLIFLFMFLCCGSGCSRYYVGRGAPVVLDGVGEWTHNAADVAALERAAALWNALGASFTLDPSSPGQHLPIYVEPIPWWLTACESGAGCFWIDEGEIWVDPRRTPDEYLMQVFAHELGHAIGLDHDKEGVMQATASGVLSALSDEDVAEYRALWGTPTPGGQP